MNLSCRPETPFKKLLQVDDIGDVTITNDGATILKLLEVEHPAAKVTRPLSEATSFHIAVQNLKNIISFVATNNVRLNRRSCLVSEQSLHFIPVTDENVYISPPEISDWKSTTF
jgi:hypothetical protein